MRFFDAIGRTGAIKINLDLVAELRSVRNNGKEFYECVMANEECLGRIRLSDLPDEFTIVPDTTNTRVVVFYIDTGGTIGCFRYPVVAWKIINGEYAKPLICASPEGVYCLELSSGLFVCADGDDTYESFEEARQYAATQLLLLLGAHPERVVKGGML
jgi:hypothetical protein